MYEKESSPSHQPEQRTAEQTPHSGVHYDERPVRDFDTPLRDAVERGLVNPTPESPAGIAPEKKSKKGVVVGVSAGLAGAVVAAGAILGVGMANSNEPDKAPVAEAPVDSSEPTVAPGETQESGEQEISVEALRIPADLSPEEFGETFVVDRLGAWQMAGATPENKTEVVLAEDKLAFLRGVAEENGEIFADALLVQDWRSDPALSQFVGALKGSNSTSIENWFKTYNDGSGDEPFRKWIDVESTTLAAEQPEGGVAYDIAATSRTNAADNRAREFDPSAVDIDGDKILITVTVVPVDGTARIAAISITDRE